jgi:hypothetical protein
MGGRQRGPFMNDIRQHIMLKFVARLGVHLM